MRPLCIEPRIQKPRAGAEIDHEFRDMPPDDEWWETIYDDEGFALLGSSPLRVTFLEVFKTAPAPNRLRWGARWSKCPARS